MQIHIYAYRHNNVILPRPYACDVDDSGWLWQGTIGNRLLAHNLHTAELRVTEIPEMEGHVVYSAFAWGGKVFLLFGDTSFYLIHDPLSGITRRFELPGEKPICWYGTKLPAGKLIIFDRGNARILLFDAPEAPPRIVESRWKGDQSRGHIHSDGLVYIFAAEPARLIRFDPISEQYLGEQALPWPEVDITGRVEHDGVLYCADSAGGRLLPLNLSTQQWGEPINNSDFEKVFGFIGNGFSFQGKSYFNVSTYIGRSTLDAATGKVTAPTGTTVDGQEPRFLDRFMVFDPKSRSFDYLVAPEHPDGLSILCYFWSDRDRFAITGMVVPWEKPGVPAVWGGPWLILQSHAANRARDADSNSLVSPAEQNLQAQKGASDE